MTFYDPIKQAVDEFTRIFTMFIALNHYCYISATSHYCYHHSSLLSLASPFNLCLNLITFNLIFVYLSHAKQYNSQLAKSMTTNPHPPWLKIIELHLVDLESFWVSAKNASEANIYLELLINIIRVVMTDLTAYGQNTAQQTIRGGCSVVQ